MKQRLIDAAIKVKHFAYCPYSNYPVGAATMGENGNIFVGCNVENSVYPLGQCAERVAIQAMVATGERKIRAVAVATNNGGTPCGACRQVISEFVETDCPIYLVDDAGMVIEYRLGDLFPLPFKL